MEGVSDIEYDFNFSLVFNKVEISFGNFFEKEKYIENANYLLEYGSYISFNGEYHHGDEDFLLQWIGYLILDMNAADFGYIVDFSGYSYSGGDGFLYWHHFLSNLNSGDDGFYPEKISFIWSENNKEAISSLIKEECDELEDLFFDSRQEAIDFLRSQ